MSVTSAGSPVPPKKTGEAILRPNATVIGRKKKALSRLSSLGSSSTFLDEMPILHTTRGESEPLPLPWRLALSWVFQVSGICFGFDPLDTDDRQIVAAVYALRFRSIIILTLFLAAFV